VNPIYTASYAEYEYDGIWPSAMTLAKNSDGLQLSALKIAETGKGYILRTNNPHPYCKENIELKLNKYIFCNIERVNLAEEVLLNEDSVVEKHNNADGSDKAQLSGNLRIKSINRNAIYSYKLLNQ
jgi:alpha-mannosidase